jgi:ribulose-phosphate 3-epimerase
MVVLMTVNPGFGGQSFIPEVLTKIEELRRIIDQKGLDIDIEVDGGINGETIAQVARAGATVFVAGNAVFSSPNYAETIALMREKISS